MLIAKLINFVFDVIKTDLDLNGIKTSVIEISR